MLAAKGYRTDLKLVSGRTVRPRGAMLHDESGRDWPYRSVLFMSFKKGGGWTEREDEEAEDNSDAIRYFGYQPRAGRLELPDETRVEDWDFVDDVHAINYSRPGAQPAESNGFLDFLNILGRPNKNFKGDYTHTFKHGWLIFAGWSPALYRLRSIYRLELPPWAEVSWKGFVTP
jgi:hypothetical protein